MRNITNTKKILTLIITLLIGIIISLKVLAPIINNINKQEDVHIIELKKLLNESICDDDWLKKLNKLCNDIKIDSNTSYLKQYYQINKNINNDYMNISNDVKAFVKAFTAKDSTRAKNNLNNIKDDIIKIEGNKLN